MLVDHQPIIYVCGTYTLACSLFILQVYFNLVGATNQYCKRVEAKLYMQKAVYARGGTENLFET